MRYAPILCLLLSGCSLLPSLGKIKLPSGVQVQAPKDNGSPAQVATSEAGVSVALPLGSRVVVTKESALPATEKTPAQPAREITEIIPAGPSAYTQKESTVAATTGTIDTSLRKHEIDVKDRAKLLWVAIACGIAGLVAKSMLPAWPALSNGLLIASPCAFAAWKFAEVPAWLWGAVIVGVLLLIAGYKRAEWDKNKDGIPDILQKPTP